MIGQGGWINKKKEKTKIQITWTRKIENTWRWRRKDKIIKKKKENIKKIDGKCEKMSI